MHFIKKYEPEVGRPRWMRFMAIFDFIGKWQQILVEKNLLIEEPFGVSGDLIEHLLKVKINPRSGIIPKKALFDFLKKDQKQNNLKNEVKI
jgi:hypothetical protein